MKVCRTLLTLAVFGFVAGVLVHGITGTGYSWWSMGFAMMDGFLMPVILLGAMFPDEDSKPEINADELAGTRAKERERNRRAATANENA